MGSIPGVKGAEGMLAWEPTDGQEEEVVGGPRGMLKGKGAVLVLGS